MMGKKNESEEAVETPKANKEYTPRANYEWVPAIATVVFIISFVVLTFAPLFSTQPESVISWLSDMKSDVILFVGLCLGFFLKVPKE